MYCVATRALQEKKASSITKREAVPAAQDKSRDRSRGKDSEKEKAKALTAGGGAS